MNKVIRSLIAGIVLFFALIGVISSTTYLFRSFQKIEPVQAELKPLKLVADRELSSYTDQEIKQQVAENEAAILVSAINYTKFKGGKYFEDGASLQEVTGARDRKNQFGGLHFFVMKGLVVEKDGTKKFLIVLKYDAFYESFNIELVEVDGTLKLINQEIREHMVEQHESNERTQQILDRIKD